MMAFQVMALQTKPYFTKLKFIKMKQLFTILLIAITIGNANAQEAVFESHFRKGGYTRLGLNFLGDDLDNTLSAKSNILASRFGGKMGFVLEKGKVFYFMSKSKPSVVNVGLDWTILSVTFNPSKKSWNNYISETGGSNAMVSMPFTASLSSKLGPVVSINPVEKLVIDVRAQVAAGIYAFGPEYSTDDYSFVALKGDAEKIGDYATISFKPNLGVTVRRAGIGLAFDYSPGKVNTSYTESTGDTDTYGEADIEANNFQVKLSLTLK